jgi:hypothetical protein
MQTVAFLKFYTAYADDQAQAHVAEKPALDKAESPAIKVDAAEGSSQETASAIAGKAVAT